VSCWFRQCAWIYLVSVERADPTFTPRTQGQVGLYQCRHCKTLSLGGAIAPALREPYDAAKHQAAYP